MCITDILNFSLPIGWDELSAIATALAVIVALRANKKSAEQLRASLAMQEQTKNVELLDKRIAMCERIQAEQPIPELTFRVLFNEEIFCHYKKWNQYISERQSAESDLQFYFAHVREPDLEGGYTTPIYDKIGKYIADMSRPDCPSELVDEYEKYCTEHEIWSNEGENGEPICYNHSKITDRIAKASTDEKKEKQVIIQLMEKFMSDSIQLSDTKKGKTVSAKSKVGTKKEKEEK